MPEWLLPLAAASLAVLILNLALLLQRRTREQSPDWAARFLSELQRWDGRLPDR